MPKLLTWHLEGWRGDARSHSVRNESDPRVDAAVRPQDDLFCHVNGRWLATTRYRTTARRTARSGRSRPGGGAGPRDRRRGRGRHGGGQRRAAHRRALHLFMDTERRGRPRRAAAARRAARARPPTRRSWPRCSAPRQRAGAAGRLGVYVDTDAKDSSRYLVHLSQSGLGLPDESYYREELRRDPRRLRRPPRAGCSPWSGVDAETAPASGRIVALETRSPPATGTSSSAATPIDLQPPTLDELPSRGARLRLGRWVDALGAVTRDVRRGRGAPARPSCRASPTLWASERSRTGRRGCVPRSSRRAPYLLDAFVDENFAFYGTHAHRAPGRSASAGSAASAWWSDAHRRGGRPSLRRAALPARGEGSDGRARRQPGRGLPARASRTLEWMSPETRERALAKLGVHAEDRLPGRSGATTARSRSTATTSSATCAARTPSRHDRQLAKIGGADRPRRVVHDAADRQRVLQPAA